MAGASANAPAYINTPLSAVHNKTTLLWQAGNRPGFEYWPEV